MGATHSGIGVEFERYRAVLFEMGLKAFAEALKDRNGLEKAIDAGADSARKLDVIGPPGELAWRLLGDVDAALTEVRVIRPGTDQGANLTGLAGAGTAQGYVGIKLAAMQAAIPAAACLLDQIRSGQ